MPAPVRSRALARRLVWPLATSIAVTFGAALYGFSVLITPGAAGADFSSGVLSAGFGGAVLVSGVVAVPVGRRADRHGIRGIVAVGATLVGAGFCAMALATAPWHVLAAWWGLIGPGTAMTLFDPAFVALEQWFDRAERNRAAGTLTLLTGLAGPVFVPGTYALVAATGWRATAALLGAAVAVTGWATAGLALSAAPPPRPADDGAPAPTRQVALAPRFVLFSLAVLALFAALEGVQVHRLARFAERGFDAATLAFWAAFASAASLPGRFVVPRLANRVEGSRVLLWLIVLLVPACALAIRGTTTWEMVGHFVLFGALFGATIPLRTVVMGDWFSGPTFGALMGLQAFAIALGRAGGPAATGWLRDATGGYAAGMALLTGLVVAAAALTWVSGRVRGAAQSSAPGSGR